MADDQRKVVITGATGGLGSEVAQQLLQLASATAIGVSVRNPDAARSFADRGVRVRHGDFDRPETLDQAFKGAERLLIISTRTGDNQARFFQQRNAIHAAERCGVKHVFYTSIVQRPGSVFAHGPGHWQTEDYLAQTGLDYTILANGNYIENLPMFLADSIMTGDLGLPADGPVAWVPRTDLAEGIARLLLSGGYEGKILFLTGCEALEFEQIAAIASAAIRRNITRRIVSDQEYAERLLARGVPEPMARGLISGFASRAQGELKTIDPALERIVKRPLRTVAEVLPLLLAQQSHGKA
jgi:uncharacterized protein YbjT (DUF2867 family)